MRNISIFWWFQFSFFLILKLIGLLLFLLFLFSSVSVHRSNPYWSFVDQHSDTFQRHTSFFTIPKKHSRLFIDLIMIHQCPHFLTLSSPDKRQEITQHCLNLDVGTYFPPANISHVNFRFSVTPRHSWNGWVTILSSAPKEVTHIKQ